MIAQIKAGYEFVVANIRAILYAVAFAIGWWLCSISYEADIEKWKKEAAQNAAKLTSEISEIQSKYDELKIKYDGKQLVTTVYVDRWKVKKECRVTNAFQQIHDNSVDGNSNLPPADFVDDYNNISCEQAVKVIRWNYLEANKKDEQIKSLQKVVEKMQDTIEKAGK